MSLDVEVAVRRDGFGLDAALVVAEGETVALLGPNGAGKTTLLGAVAGLVDLEAGSVVLGAKVLTDTAAGVAVAPERRSIGYVFQDGLLFPHLSALDNVAFALRCRGVRRAEARRRARGWLEQLGVGHRAGARPGALSGGEAQHVALARTLAAEPAALLLDEPLAALDVAARDRTRAELGRHLTGFAGPRVVVTHDPVEAMLLAQRLVVLEDGRVTHDGAAGELTRRPRSAYVARLVGLNLYRGSVRSGRLRVDGGGELVAAVGAIGSIAGPALATIRPQAVALHRDRPDGTPRNVWPVTVAGLHVHGDRVRVQLAGAPDVVAEITPDALAALRVAPGLDVWAAVKATDVDVYPDLAASPSGSAPERPRSCAGRSP